MEQTTRRQRLMPWNIGLVVVLAALALAGWELVRGGCGVPPVLAVALLAMPAVYIALMYLTLTSRD